MDSTLDDAPKQPIPAGINRALRRQVALLLLTMSVVVIPNVVSFAASILD